MKTSAQSTTQTLYDQPSHGEIEMQFLSDTEHDHYQVLGVGWDQKTRVYGCSMFIFAKFQVME